MERFFAPGALPAIAALFFLGSLVGGAVALSFRLWFGAEDKLRKTASEAVQLALKSEAFEKAIEKIAAAAFTGRSEADHAFRAELSNKVKALVGRADAQSESIVSAHRRIDSVLEMFLGVDRARVAAAVGNAPVRP